MTFMCGICLLKFRTLDLTADHIYADHDTGQSAFCGEWFFDALAGHERVWAFEARLNAQDVRWLLLQGLL